MSELNLNFTFIFQSVLDFHPKERLTEKTGPEAITWVCQYGNGFGSGEERGEESWKLE